MGPGEYKQPREPPKNQTESGSLFRNTRYLASESQGIRPARTPALRDSLERVSPWAEVMSGAAEVMKRAEGRTSALWFDQIAQKGETSWTHALAPSESDLFDSLVHVWSRVNLCQGPLAKLEIAFPLSLYSPNDRNKNGGPPNVHGDTKC